VQLKINAELKEQVYLCYIPFRMSFYFTVKDAERENSTSLLVFSPQNWIPSQLPQRSKVFARWTKGSLRYGQKDSARISKVEN